MGIFLVFLLIAGGSFFSLAELSLAASRRVKLKVMAGEGSDYAARILAFQEQPGMFFTTVQIGVNAVGILGGIAGDYFWAPVFVELFARFLSPELARSAAFMLSFVLVTTMFVLFADLIPKRIAMVAPEKVALKLVNPMVKVIFLLSPLAKLFNAFANGIFKLLRMPQDRDNAITSDDIYAMMDAGAMAGILRKQEKELIDNVLELETRTVTSAMTAREQLIFFDVDDADDVIKKKVLENPHSTYPVCRKDIDHIIGYVDSKDLLDRILKNESLSLQGDVELQTPLVIPDTLTLAEAMDHFRGMRGVLAIVLNEYSLVVGIILLKDIMEMLMGDLVGEEAQIMKRENNSWLVDGVTPIDDVRTVFNIDEFPDAENYETLGGFLTYMLRRIPHRMDHVSYRGYKFEVLDVDHYKIDQVLVTKLEDKTKKERTPQETTTD